VKKQKVDANPMTQTAFPAKRDTNHTPGMSLRDYFAVEAMSGLLADEYIRTHWSAERIADHAYMMADAMVARGVKVESEPHCFLE